MENRIFQIPPIKTPTRKPVLYPLKQPFQIDPSCVLALLPQRDDKWFDYSGKGNHGSINGATWTSKGEIGPTLYFDGIDDYVRCSQDNSLKTDTTLTYSAWVIRTTENVKEVYLNNRVNIEIWATFNQDGNQKHDVYLKNLSSPGYHHSNTSILPNKLYYICFTYDGAKLRLFTNGKPDGEVTTSGTISGPNATLTIGNRDDLAFPNYFTGHIHMLTLYNRVLTADEIRRNYEMGRIR